MADNRALIRAEGFLRDVEDAANLQLEKLKDRPNYPEEVIDDLQRIIDSTKEIQTALAKLINIMNVED